MRELILKESNYMKYCKGNLKNANKSWANGNPLIMPRMVRGDIDDAPPSDPAWLGWNIRRQGSHIYFYEEINCVTQLILEVMLRDAVKDVLTSHVISGGDTPEPVTIHVNSPGGEMFSGFALYDYIKTSQIPIVCLVEGLCASAATLIMLACQHRIMSPNSSFLMHQCSWGAYGDNRLMQDLAGNANKDMKRLRKIYMTETKIGSEFTDPVEREKYVQHLLEHDFEFDAEECEKFGICTPCEDDDGDVELSEERVKKLQDFIKKLAEEQQKENDKKESEEKAKAEKAAKKENKLTKKISEKAAKVEKKEKADKKKKE